MQGARDGRSRPRSRTILTSLGALWQPIEMISVETSIAATELGRMPFLKCWEGFLVAIEVRAISRFAAVHVPMH
jgi:hypothetical protein